MANIRDITRYVGDSEDIRIQVLNNSGLPYDLSAVTEIVLGVDEELNPKTVSPLAGIPGVVEAGTSGWVVFTPDSILSDLPAGKYWAQVRFIENSKIRSTGKFAYTQEASLFNMPWGT